MDKGIGQLARRLAARVVLVRDSLCDITLPAFGRVDGAEVAMHAIWVDKISGWQKRLHEATSPQSRRDLIGHLGMALGGLAALGVGISDLDAKKKKKRKKKNQDGDKPAKPSDWTGKWSTKLSNGVKGSANLTYNGTNLVTGTYSNSVGSGTLSCEAYQSVFDDYVCSGDYQQGDGETGFFLITLTDRNH